MSTDHKPGIEAVIRTVGEREAAANTFGKNQVWWKAGQYTCLSQLVQAPIWEAKVNMSGKTQKSGQCLLKPFFLQGIQAAMWKQPSYLSQVQVENNCFHGQWPWKYTRQPGQEKNSHTTTSHRHYNLSFLGINTKIEASQTFHDQH